MGDSQKFSKGRIIDLPSFHALPVDWPIVRSMFVETTLVYKNSDLENLLRLQKILKYVAREEVAAMLINPVNVDHIIKRLQFKYGQSGLLIRSQLVKISKIQQISENNLDKIISLAAKVSNLITFLKLANAFWQLQNPVLLSDLISKLPMRTRIEWKTYAYLGHFGSSINQIAMDI